MRFVADSGPWPLRHTTVGRKGNFFLVGRWVEGSKGRRVTMKEAREEAGSLAKSARILLCPLVLLHCRYCRITFAASSRTYSWANQSGHWSWLPWRVSWSPYLSAGEQHMAASCLVFRPQRSTFTLTSRRSKQRFGPSSVSWTLVAFKLKIFMSSCSSTCVRRQDNSSMVLYLDADTTIHPDSIAWGLVPLLLSQSPHMGVPKQQVVGLTQASQMPRLKCPGCFCSRFVAWDGVMPG